MLLYVNISVVYVPHAAEAQKRKPCIHKGDKSKQSVTHLEEVLFPGLKPICCVLLQLNPRASMNDTSQHVCATKL